MIEVTVKVVCDMCKTASATLPWYLQGRTELPSRYEEIDGFSTLGRLNICPECLHKCRVHLSKGSGA